MQVLKFGGSSVANAVNINKVAVIVQNAVEKDNTIVVVSALGGITDALLHVGSLATKGDESFKEELQVIEARHLEAVKELIPFAQQSSVLSMVKKSCNDLEDICNGIFLLRELSARTKDRIISYGELLSSQIIAARFKALNVECIWKDARELIITDSHYGYAAVDFDKTYLRAKEFFSPAPQKLFLIPGFIASDENGNTTTLGRGGSDYTAAVLAAAIDATSLEIWTDVSGMMTANPSLVQTAKIIQNISYQEAMELSHFGAKVIYPPTIQPVMTKNIPVRIKNTFEPEHPGTLIKAEGSKNGGSVRGISSMGKIALLSLEGSGMIGIPGFSKRLFQALANERINVILITQSSSEHSICVAINEANCDAAKRSVDAAFKHEIETKRLEPLVVEKDLSIIALVGDSMKSHPGISGKMFGTLGKNGVNVRAIAQGSSERNISAVISTADVKKSVNVLHEEFFETSYKQLNLFVAGVGNVGSRLLAQLNKQQPYLQQHMSLQVRVVGIANSRKMLFHDEGINLNTWRDLLEDGEDMDLQTFIDVIGSKNLRNSVFADITANDEVAANYPQLLEKSISVVACNKVACSSEYAYYKKLKDLSREFNCLYLFETNVGAGLPVIDSLNNLMRSGDTINKIEAVLSGTLNFVFNNYNGEKTFADVVKQAQNEGYTEPDPRLDLGGTDVMRKIMILARESGEKLEMEDVTNNTFMPASCMQGSVEDFYSAMAKEESYFLKLYKAAADEGKKLKFVAKFENGKASVGLQHIDATHDFYHLYGKDNIVLFHTTRYPEQPMVVKGAGAGAEVTASGVFADIIRTSR